MKISADELITCRRHFVPCSLASARSVLIELFGLLYHKKVHLSAVSLIKRMELGENSMNVRYGRK